MMRSQTVAGPAPEEAGKDPGSKKDIKIRMKMKLKMKIARRRIPFI